MIPQVPIFDIMRKFDGERVHEDVRVGECGAVRAGGDGWRQGCTAIPAQQGRERGGVARTIPRSLPSSAAPRPPPPLRRPPPLPRHAPAALPGARGAPLSAQPVLCGEEPHDHQLSSQELGPGRCHPGAQRCDRAGGRGARVSGPVRKGTRQPLVVLTPGPTRPTQARMATPSPQSTIWCATWCTRARRGRAPTASTCCARWGRAARHVCFSTRPHPRHTLPPQHTHARTPPPIRWRTFGTRCRTCE